MDEEIKEVGEMATIEDEEDIAIEEDYTALEAETIIIDDDSNIQTDAEYEQAVAQKELADEAREALSAVLLSVLEKGEINDDDIAEIAAQQEIYTENVTALKILGLTTEDEKSTAGKSTTNVITSNIDYDELIKVLSEKADWLYTDEDGQIMLNGEVVPKIKVMELEAEKIKADVGEFKDLTAENFTAVNAKIDNLEVTDLTAVNAEIENLKANKADIETLNANVATINTALIGKANVSDLNATNANIANLQAGKADITDLNAANGNITNLQSVVAQIQTLIGGNLTMDNIQSLILTSDKVTIADALIKDAMIDTVSANKINTGTINTNNVSIQSEDGSMVINGTTQQFKDENNVVRIQIGKDATGNFTFCLFSQDGQGILLDADGIKAGAVPDGLIVNDMVADNANISGGKLDISSVISSINGNENTLNSSKIKFDDTNQTLDVAFNQLKSKVETIENITVDGDLSSVMEQVTTNTTNIGVMQGQISSLISNTTITKENGEVVQLKDEYNSTKDTVNSHTQTIGSLETNLSTAEDNIKTVTSKQAEFEQSLDGFKTTVSATYQTKDDMKDYSTTSAMNSAINQKANEITSSVSQTYATKDDLDTVNDKFSDYSTTSQMNSAITQKANEITTTVSETYATQTTTNSMLSQIQQNANNISTKVDVNGVISSINQSSETVAINANKINLNGYVSNDDANWSIDNEGNMRAENLKIEGDVGADTLSVNYIDNPCYPATLAGSVHLYVNANTGNDDYTIDDILQSYDEAEEYGYDSYRKKFKTLQGALDASPAFLNNKNLRITLETDTTEDVYIRGFTSGAVRIYLNGNTIYGNVHGYANSAAIYLYGGTVDNTTATQGVIHPNTGFNIGSRCISAGFEACQYVALYKIKAFGADNKPSNISSNYKVAVASSAGTGSVYCSDVAITNCAIGFRTNNMGCIHVAKSSGKASRYGFESTTGGQISIADGNQAGGAITNTSESSGGQVWFKSPTFDGSTASTDTTTAPSTSTAKTMTIRSTYGDTYRSSVYNNWKRDGTVRQGDYGYGDCTGCWFFGTAFAELKGKTITKVQITINRQTGGSSVPVEHKLWMHRYASRPSGAPTLTSGWSQTFRLATGNSTAVAITNSTVLNAISAGTCKGFALRNTYDSAHYSVCSGNVTVKITYTE